LLDAAMPIDLHLPPTSVGGGSLVCVLGPDCQLLVKEFSALNFEAKCLFLSYYLGREGIWCVEAFYAPNSFL